MSEERNSGLLLVDKPAGCTSADVTNRLKKAFGWSRIGHGGTLDPFATGLLVVLVGDGTKVARFLLGGEKEYEAVAHLGVSTNTGDVTGAIQEERPIPGFTHEEWQSIFSQFLGTRQQLPPLFSAVKIKGRPLHSYARAGEAVERKARDVEIKELSLLQWQSPLLRFRVRSSGGTYIRVLAEDIALAAESRAHLVELRRVASGNLKLQDALPLADILANPAPALRPISEALYALPRMNCSPEEARLIRHGNLSVFERMRDRIQWPGYFLIECNQEPIAIANHHPMIHPWCSIERVFQH
jgi:tRNA pseudouridine55 synthase